MAWQDTATQMLGPMAPEVIQGLSQINPSYDWSRHIAAYVPALNQAYGEDWKDPSRGSSAGIVSALTKNAAAEGNSWAKQALSGVVNRQHQQEAAILKAQNPPDKGLFGDFGGLAQLAALIPGPQQPFLLGANAVNAASQGNLIGAGLNAFGAYNGGIGKSFDKLGDMFSSTTAGPSGGGSASFNGYGGASNMDLPLVDDYSNGYGDYNPNNLPSVDDYSNGYGGGDYYDFIPPEGGPLSEANMNPNLSTESMADLIKKYGPNVAKTLGGLFGSGDSRDFRSGSKGGYQFPWGDAIGSAIGAYGANQNAKTLSDAMRYAADKADPFASQRPQYQAELPGAMQSYRDLASSKDAGYADLSGRLDRGFNEMQGQYRDQYNTAATGYQKGFDDLWSKIQAENTQMRDPNYWNNDSLLAGLNDMAVNDTSRKLASQGYNMSGNVPMEVAQRLQQNNASYVPKFIDTITNNQNVSLGGYNTNTNTQLGQLNQNANTNLGAYNTNAGNQLQGYNNNSRNALDASFNNMRQTGTYAGGEVNPGAAGNIAMEGAKAGYNANNQMYGNLGAGLQSVFQGRQPSIFDQVLNGTSRNQSLSDMWSL